MENEIKQIKSLMETILLHSCDGVNFRPIKGTTKQQCYNVLGEIQSLLKTNVINKEKNEVTIGGKKYYAVDDVNDDCQSCAFNHTDECKFGDFHCSALAREDRRSVIWVPAGKRINENEIIIKGKKYKAVTAPNFGYCDGCDLLPKGRTGCDGLWKIDETMPSCSVLLRGDDRDVIWKQQNEQK